MKKNTIWSLEGKSGKKKKKKQQRWKNDGTEIPEEGQSSQEEYETYRKQGDFRLDCGTLND